MANRLAIRRAEFEAWVLTARPGESIEYHRGMLGADRDKATSRLDGDRRKELNAIARCAYDLAVLGKLTLVQRRMGREDFSYLAIRASG